MEKIKTKKRIKRTEKQKPVLNIPNDILESIFKHLLFWDLVRAKAVSRLWNSTADSILSSSSHTSLRTTPWLLLLPPKPYTGFYYLKNLEENMPYELNNIMPPSHGHKHRIIGSSFGHLITGDKKGIITLVNPLTRNPIQLPPLDCLLVRSFHYEDLLKAVITSEPYQANGKPYCVILMYQLSDFASLQGIGYFRKTRNGKGSWTRLNCRYNNYLDILCHGNLFYALSKEGCVEIWDVQDLLLGNCPSIKVEVPAPILRGLKWTEIPALIPRDLDWIEIPRRKKVYLVGVGEEILLVVEHMNLIRNGRDSDMKCFKDVTKLFHLWKLDLGKEMWVEVEPEFLGDCSLFLGENGGLSASMRNSLAYEGGKIYHNDDGGRGWSLQYIETIDIETIYHMN